MAFSSCLMGVPRYANGKLCEVMVGTISERNKQSKSVGRRERERERERIIIFPYVATCGANRLKNIYCCSCRVAQLQLQLGIA